ncbi:MAG: PstS family phosphate ABC transporter substrate-binding protein, partial [Cyanothece sp. SIO1E1]|nr:PstS family phosphate ABC transporter substrate-binding protein [Cyanothece sp. SIO1E1]
SGEVLIDGSSTVFPISEAMAEEFQVANPGVRLTVGVSGSGGGFKKFCAGETDISNASRPIKQSEIDLCAEAGIEFVEVPIAFDGLSIVVNTDNDWATCLTAEELGAMWEPAAEAAVTSWSQVRKEFPDQPLALYGPSTDSGTYDYFVEATVPDDAEGTRGDYTASEDDNVIFQGVQADKGGLGFFSFAYYEENKETLKVVPIENSAGECVEPTGETIEAGTYNPLSRPIFFYVKTSSLDNPAVLAFVQYQTDAANGGLISEVGYVPLPGEILGKVQERVDGAVTGSIFEGGSAVGINLNNKL